MAWTNPRWIKARYTGECCSCSRKIKRGDNIVYFPRTKKTQCEVCGEDTMKGERAERSMERFGTDIMYDY